MEAETNEYDAEYIKRYTSRPWYRKKILRKIELFPAIWNTRGKTIDVGCGTGDLLEVLPKGSVGLDINPHAIDYCLEQKLDAILYDAFADDLGKHSVFDKYGNVEELVKGTINGQKMVSQKVDDWIGSDNEDIVTQRLKMQGVPESADDYIITYPETFSGLSRDIMLCLMLFSTSICNTRGGMA